MIASAVRCLAGFLLACLAGALVRVGFVITPEEVVGASWERLGAAGTLVALATVHNVVLWAPFALAGIIASEQRGARNPVWYLAAPAAFAATVFLVRAYAGGMDMPAMVARYVLAAHAAAGAGAGLAYWLVAGRHAGQPRAAPAEAPPAGQGYLRRKLP